MDNKKIQMSDTRKAMEYWRIFKWAYSINQPEKFVVRNEECGVESEVEELNEAIDEMIEKIYNLLDRQSDFLSDEEIDSM